jgi:hypothetical protein
VFIDSNAENKNNNNKNTKKREHNNATTTNDAYLAYNQYAVPA